jgi:hypothetical protein
MERQANAGRTDAGCDAPCSRRRAPTAPYDTRRTRRCGGARARSRLLRRVHTPDTEMRCPRSRHAPAAARGVVCCACRWLMRGTTLAFEASFGPCSTGFLRPRCACIDAGNCVRWRSKLRVSISCPPAVHFRGAVAGWWRERGPTRRSAICCCSLVTRLPRARPSIARPVTGPPTCLLAAPVAPCRPRAGVQAAAPPRPSSPPSSYPRRRAGGSDAQPRPAAGVRTRRMRPARVRPCVLKRAEAGACSFVAAARKPLPQAAPRCAAALLSATTSDGQAGRCRPRCKRRTTELDVFVGRRRAGRDARLWPRGAARARAAGAHTRGTQCAASKTNAAWSACLSTGAATCFRRLRCRRACVPPALTAAWPPAPHARASHRRSASARARSRRHRTQQRRRAGGAPAVLSQSCVSAAQPQRWARAAAAQRGGTQRSRCGALPHCGAASSAGAAKRANTCPLLGRRGQSHRACGCGSLA